ncbi:MAG TPA: 2-oxo acid dehydrogenase subunit E2 [Candidatus Competibacter sp.]|nr:2-oxo acid dehydrogenase subunit E2 [Candidatus Competibacter sp.]
MHSIVIPKLNANDDVCILTAWSAANGERVSAGAPLAVVETSKTTLELVAEADGLLLRDFEAGDEARVGQTIGYLFPDEVARAAFLDSRARAATETPNLHITRKARDLMDRHRLIESDLAALGKSVIRESDVRALLEARAGEPDRGPPPMPARTGRPVEAIELTRHQRAVARTVTASRREIPDAFLLIKIDCDRALDSLVATSATARMQIGLLEALVWLTGRLRSSYPHFFGQVIDDESFLPAKTAHIGVTLDQGRGLFVPVVRDADRLTLEQVAETLDEYRYNAFRGEFEESALGEGTFSVAFIAEPDVVFSVPVILPGQVCMLSLCAVMEELVFDDGEVRARRVIHLGLAYDHRFINGREAGAFCRDLKNAIESWGEDHVGR